MYVVFRTLSNNHQIGQVRLFHRLQGERVLQIAAQELFFLLLFWFFCALLIFFLLLVGGFLLWFACVRCWSRLRLSVPIFGRGGGKDDEGQPKKKTMGVKETASSKWEDKEKKEGVEIKNSNMLRQYLPPSSFFVIFCCLPFALESAVAALSLTPFGLPIKKKKKKRIEK
jgi:hypothetical protein